MKKIKKLFALLLLFLFVSVSCRRPNLDSMAALPVKYTVVVANPMTNFNRLNSFVKVRVIATIVVSGMNANNVVQQYFTKTQEFTPDSFGTPPFLNITDVNLPANGPYLVQATLESKDCTAFPSLPNNCSPSVGARPRYSTSRSVSPGTNTPSGNFTMDFPIFQTSICCN